MHIYSNEYIICSDYKNICYTDYWWYWEDQSAVGRRQLSFLNKVKNKYKLIHFLSIQVLKGTVSSIQVLKGMVSQGFWSMFSSHDSQLFRPLFICKSIFFYVVLIFQRSPRCHCHHWHHGVKSDLCNLSKFFLSVL